MKFLCKIVLFIFISFLTTPTIVSVIDKSIDISYFYNMSEEENHGALNEIKSIVAIYSIPLKLDYEGLQKTQFLILNDRKVKSINLNIFVPPPELI